MGAKKIECKKCGEKRAPRLFLKEFKNCVDCEYEKITENGGFKFCKVCRKWKEKFDTKQCTKCNEAYKKYQKTWARKKGVREKNKPLKCEKCGIEKRIHAFTKKSKICRSCTYIEKNTKEGRMKCKICCVWYLPVFMDKTRKRHCCKCAQKERKWSRKKARELRKDPKWRKYFLEYSRWYYYHVYKIFYNKTLNLQWAYNMCKPRKKNREGYWYCLNRQMFKGMKMSCWWDQINQIAHLYRKKPRELHNEKFLGSIGFKKYKDDF